MSLPKNQQEGLFSVINELPDFLPEDDPMMVFSKTIYPAFTDKDFEDCYSTKGRNAISPAFLACVTLLQFRENLSDPETAEAVIRRLDWKIALHLRLRENVSFDSSTLCYYRRRLKDNGKICLIFNKIIGLAQEKGFIKKTTKQRIDATHIISHVNRISTTDLIFRTVKCLVEEIEKKDPEYYGKQLPEHIKERYGKRFSSFGMSKDKRADKLAEIVEDGLYLKSLLEKVSSPKLDDLEQLEIMDTIFEENVKITTKEIEDRVIVHVQGLSHRYQVFAVRTKDFVKSIQRFLIRLPSGERRKKIVESRSMAFGNPESFVQGNPTASLFVFSNIVGSLVVNLSKQSMNGIGPVADKLVPLPTQFNRGSFVPPA